MLILRAQEILEMTEGRKSLAYADTLANLGSYYGLRKEYSKGQAALEDALEIKKSILGDNHPEVAPVFNNLAAFCEFQGQYDRAEQNYKQALEIMKTFLKDDHESVAKVSRSIQRVQDKKAGIAKK